MFGINNPDIISLKMKIAIIVIIGCVFMLHMIALLSVVDRLFASRIETSNTGQFFNITEYGDTDEAKKLISDIFPESKIIRPKRKVLMFFFDGLRESLISGDFVNYVGNYKKYRMDVFEKYFNKYPKNFKLATSLVQMPTNTYPRVNTIMRGNYPPFFNRVDETFEYGEATEDTIIDQILNNGYTISNLENEVFSYVFPGKFPDQQNYGLEIDVQKIYNTNKLVLKYLDNSTDWDVALIDWQLIDHSCHSLCLDCEQTQFYLNSSNALLEQIIEQLPENITLFVFVDHGRQDYKDHGGPSDGETHSIFSMYQKDSKFRYGLDNRLVNGKLPIIQQIDISGVLADLLQIPRPYNSISRVLPEFLTYSDNATDFEVYVDILKTILLNEIQVSSYC